MNTRILAAAAALTYLAPGLVAQVSLPLMGGGTVPSEIHLPGCSCGAHGGAGFLQRLVYGGEATLPSRSLPGDGAAVNSGFTIQINAGPGLTANPAALAAFQQAAGLWQNLFTDPITVNIDADMQALGAGVIGSTGSSFVTTGFAGIRGQMIADNAGSVTQGVTDALPANPGVFVPLGTQSLTPFMTKANAKALGFGVPAGADAQINFSSNFAFDFDPSNGINPGQMDFRTVAFHEIGHALGFVSVVDQFDNGAADAGFFPLDLFRFGPTANPNDLAGFGSASRDWRPNVASFTDIINPARGSGPEYAMSTGRITGDGRQASHWKDNDLSGSLIGLMDPTLGFGQSVAVTAADLNAFDVIGWNVVPEPGEYAAAFGVAALGFAVWRRRARRA